MDQTKPDSPTLENSGADLQFNDLLNKETEDNCLKALTAFNKIMPCELEDITSQNTCYGFLPCLKINN